MEYDEIASHLTLRDVENHEPAYTNFYYFSHKIIFKRIEAFSEREKSAIVLYGTIFMHAFTNTALMLNCDC